MLTLGSITLFLTIGATFWLVGFIRAIRHDIKANKG